MHEFNLIEQYFNWPNPPAGVSVTVGDDAAVLDIPQAQQLVTSVDTVIEGVHFPIETSADAIAYKALAVNLSDLAAMGARPQWFTLALTLPDVNSIWLQAFSTSLKALADQYGCFLMGGDTTRGVLSVTIQVMGLVNQGEALLRRSAQVGDKIYVTGTLGDAAAGLHVLQNKLILADEHQAYCLQRLNYPTPRVVESRLIKHYANACIDVSDGLLQDLSHILQASNCSAQLDTTALPLSSALQSLDVSVANQLALTGGDDYELLFTLSASQAALFEQTHPSLARCIGNIVPKQDDSAQQLVDQKGKPLNATGYNHFHE